MQISYFHTSEAVPPVLPVSEGGPDAAVVIDVLRATTTIAWSLQNGAEAIQAFADLGELEAAAAAGLTSAVAVPVFAGEVLKAVLGVLCGDDQNRTLPTT